MNVLARVICRCADDSHVMALARLEPLASLPVFGTRLNLRDQWVETPLKVVGLTPGTESDRPESRPPFGRRVPELLAARRRSTGEVMTERHLTTPKTPDQAAAALHRFAQAQKALRLYRKAKGRRATTPEELAAWVQQQQSRGRLNPIEPERQDYQAAQREHPDLVLLSNRGQPVPAGAKLRMPPSPVRLLQRAILKARLALVSVSLNDRRTRVLNSTEHDS